MQDWLIYVCVCMCPYKDQLSPLFNQVVLTQKSSQAVTEQPLISQCHPNSNFAAHFWEVPSARQAAELGINTLLIKNWRSHSSNFDADNVEAA